MAALSGLLQAHEEGAPFSGAIIDPPILHHAHIENEQRINFFGLGGVEDAAGQKRPAFETELELAYGSPNFTSLIPAVTLWHVRSGWQVRLGVQVPVSGPREADQVFVIQFGNHLNWRRLLGAKPRLHDPER